MPRTFGGATTNDITWASGGGPTFGGTQRVALVMGWWYPTTLTATRGLWSFGNNWGAEINSTTSELRLRSDNTTDGQWTTTGVGLAVDQWAFLAFLVTNINSGPTIAWRVWTGTVESPPAEVTVTNAVSPSGNFTGSTNFYIGNKGTGSLAFQGDIAKVGYINTQSTASATTNPLGIATHGVITADEAERVLKRHVIPYWLESSHDTLLAGFPMTHEGGAATQVAFYECTPQCIVHLWTSGGISDPSATSVTVNGTAGTNNRDPRPAPATPLQRRCAGM